MKPKFDINEQDIAAANLGFQLVQVLIDVLIERKVLGNEDVLPILRDMANWYRKPGNPDRKQIRDAAAEVLEKIAPKYDTPPTSKQH